MVNLFLLFFVIVVTESKVCRRSSDFEYGQWIPGAQNCGLLDKYSPNDNVTDFANWCWKPFGCESTKFSAKHFCKLMKGRTMLMVGDSLLYNMYVAFYNLLASEINVSPPTVSGNFGFYPGKDYGKVCNGNASIIYLRNDHWGIKNERTDKDINLNQLWKSGLPEVDILMMNKGHHVVPKEVSEKQFVDQTTEAVAYLKNYKLTERSGHHKNNNGIIFLVKYSPLKLTFLIGSSEVFMHHRNGTYHHRPISFYFLQTSPGHAFCLSLDSKPYTDLVSNVEQYNTIHQKYEVEKLSKFKHAKGMINLHFSWYT
jgi:hypothetical protein